MTLYDVINRMQALKNVKKHPWRSVTFNTLPWVFFSFFKLYKWYQIAQSVSINHLEKNNLMKLVLINSFIY